MRFGILTYPTNQANLQRGISLVSINKALKGNFSIGLGETHCRVCAKALSLSTRGKVAEGGGGAITFFAPDYSEGDDRIEYSR